jgi:succinate dehydrogenase flavin-adding protein (antitoxin of CptAB toxin-antitoxin module)
MSCKELQKLLDISDDDLEEWVIDAMSNGIIDAQID